MSEMDDRKQTGSTRVEGANTPYYMSLYTRNSPYWLLLAFLLSGCLPSSCSRVEPRSISPSDSLSRELASTFAVDTLVVVDQIDPGSEVLRYPKTLGYDPEGLLWVTDTAQHIVMAFEPGATEPTVRDTIPESYPYLAGFRDGSVFVFSPASHSIFEITDGEVVREIEIEGELPERGGLRYVTATETGFFVKVVAPDFDGYLALLDKDGAIQSKIALPGPEWRYAGLLRSTPDALYSLSGYRPIIDRYRDNVLDSLILLGFDSPMLPRSYQFIMGDTHEPPLLSASAAFTDDRIFVLNMRPGWVQIDVYDLGGQLQHIITQPDPIFSRDYYPTDIAVRAAGDGGYEIAIALLEPVPRIDRYYWHP